MSSCSVAPQVLLMSLSLCISFVKSKKHTLIIYLHLGTWGWRGLSNATERVSGLCCGEGPVLVQQPRSCIGTTATFLRRCDSNIPAMVECEGPRFQATGPQTAETHFLVAWKLEGHDHGASRAGFSWDLSPWLVMALFLLSLRGLSTRKLSLSGHYHYY